MSTLKSNHIFLALLSASFLCAFVLPAHLTNSLRGSAAGLFNPLSAPVRRLAISVDEHFAQHTAATTSDASTLLAENDELRQDVVRLQAEVQRLQKLEGERQNLGDLKTQCLRIPVAASDAGGRDALILTRQSAVQLHENDPAIYAGGLAGRVESAGNAARVRLITDDGFAVTGAFVRFVEDGGSMKKVELPGPAPLVRGMGDGKLAVVGMTFADCLRSGLAKGDWVVLDDPLWPPSIRGERLGRVISVGPMRSAPLFADIHLATESDLMHLSDVWVLATGE
jgi:hypothetical protein